MWSEGFVLCCIYAILQPVICISTSRGYGDGANWMEDGDKVMIPTSNRKTLSVFCYKPREEKSLFQLWQSAMFHLDINDDNFNQHIGSTMTDVKQAYEEERSLWSVGMFGTNQKLRTLKINVFNDTCMGISSDQRYSVRLQVVHIDYRKVVTTVLGVFLIILSKTLSENALFYYICGISVGISASLLVLVYFISRLFPRKPLMYSMLAGGWAVGFYLIQLIYEQFSYYKTYFGWYCLVTGFLSFIVCYKKGPPTDVRSKNLIMWTIQILGSISLYFSSEYKEAAMGVALFCFLVKYFPRKWIFFLIRYWYTKFPRQRKLLSDEEYFAEGAVETKKALQELREHCNSPDCAQWKTMLKLKEPQRFASFVEGNSHLSDDEVLDYETYAFSSERSFQKRSTRRSGSRGDGVNGTPKTRLNGKTVTTRRVELSSDDSEDDSD